MYRHFAALTLAISVTVALFADGDVQQAVAKSQKDTNLRNAEKEKFGSRKLVDKRGEQPGRFGSSEFSDRLDAPMDVSGDSHGSFVPASFTARQAPIIVEIDQAAVARMTAPQRSAYLRMLEQEKRKRMAQAPVRPTPAQIQALAAQSAARSGSEKPD